MFDVAEVVAAWAPAIPTQHAVAIVSVLVYSTRTPGDTLPPVAARLLEFDPTIEISIADLVRLRAILARRLASQPHLEDAAGASLRLHAALDDLVATVAERQLERLERTALLDELTGVGNRRAMDRELAAAVSHALRHAAPLAVAMIDLDGLKRVNDTEGHAAGDELIRSMGRRLATNARGGDSVYRVGGDEFLVVARDSRPPEVEALLARVRPEAPRFSAGIAGLPEDGSDSATLLRVADSRLYAGRGERVVVVPAATAARGRTGRGSRGVLLVPAAAVVAEGVRHRRGVDVRGADLATWTAVAAGGPLALAGAGWFRRVSLLRIGAVSAATLGSLLMVLPVLENEPGTRAPQVAAPPVIDTPGTTIVPRPQTTPTTSPPVTTPTTAEPTSPPTTVLDAPVLVVARPTVRPGRPLPSIDRPPIVDVIDDDDDDDVDVPDVVAVGNDDDDDDSDGNGRGGGRDDDVAKSGRRGRGNPHLPGQTGDPHEPGERGDPHRTPPPGRATGKH